MPANKSADRADEFTEPRTALAFRASLRPSLQGDGPSTQYPCRPLDDALLQFKAALAAAPPPDVLDDLPQLPQRVRELVLDRIEAALFERRIHIDCDTYAALLMAVMPAEFDIPDPPARPTPTAPKTRARELVYAARCRRAVAIFHAADRNGQDPADALAVAWGDGRAPRVKAWVRPGPDRNRGRSGTVPGAKPKRKPKGR